MTIYENGVFVNCQKNVCRTIEFLGQKLRELYFTDYLFDILWREHIENSSPKYVHDLKQY